MNKPTIVDSNFSFSVATWRTRRNIRRLLFWSIRSITRKHDVIHKTGST